LLCIFSVFSLISSSLPRRSCSFLWDVLVTLVRLSLHRCLLMLAFLLKYIDGVWLDRPARVRPCVNSLRI
jgi:hypothetical protein